MDRIDSFIDSSLACVWAAFLNVSGINFKGNSSIICPPASNAICSISMLMATVTKIGEIKQPIWPMASIEPAPMDWIYTGKDSVWIKVTIVDPVTK